MPRPPRAVDAHPPRLVGQQHRRERLVHPEDIRDEDGRDDDPRDLNAFSKITNQLTCLNRPKGEELRGGKTDGGFFLGWRLQKAKSKGHTYSVQRQPNSLATTALPTVGATSGPTITASAYAVIAFPRCRGAHMSASDPAVTATGAAPKKPLKKRPMKMVCALAALAVANAKQADTKKAGRMAGLRPWSSESGAKRSGPVPRLVGGGAG